MTPNQPCADAAKWKDVTSYARGMKQHIPLIWERRSGSIVLRVHRHISYGDDAWLMWCNITHQVAPLLNSKELEAAKAEAIKAVQDYIYSIEIDAEKL